MVSHYLTLDSLRVPVNQANVVRTQNSTAAHINVYISHVVGPQLIRMHNIATHVYPTAQAE
jgi:hypothetical protein